MEPALNSLAAGFPWLILFLLLATALYIAGMVVYVQLTPHKEITLIRDGNTSAAVSFSAFLIALALPLAACLTSSVSLFDLGVWGTVSLLLQLFLFRMTDMLLPDLPKRITQDDMAAAVVLPPDWSIYLIVLGVILLRANLSNNDVEAIEPPPLGASLPDIRPNDPAVMVELGVRQSGSGTAFSIDGSGTWLTARHVVDSCDRVGLIAGSRSAVTVDQVIVSKKSDTAILKTRWQRPALPTDLNSRRTTKEAGFFFGFPQGRPGEVAGALLGRHQLITRGRYNVEESVLAWAELGRTRGLRDAKAAKARPVSTDDFGKEADSYRRDRRIAQVICLVD